jgi:ribosomal protein S10
MKTYNLIIKSKNQKSLLDFVDFLDKNLAKNFNHLKKSMQKKTDRKIITILKSPHVNKKAQEQFEIRLFSKDIKVNTSQTLKFLVFLKKVKTYLFTDISIKIKFFNSINQHKILQRKVLNPDNLAKKRVLNIYKNLELNKLKHHRKTEYEKFYSAFFKNENLLQMFDAYGKY